MPCAPNQYCSESGTCEQECTPNTPDPRCGKSPEGETYLCGLNGKCTQELEPEGPDLGVGVGGAHGTGGSTGEGGGDGCIEEEVRFTPEIPNVVLLIDQSRSMTGEQGFTALVEQEIEAGTYVPWECEEAGNPIGSQGPPQTWRWNVVRTVLFNPTDGIVKQLDGDVRFGMALYSSRNGNIAGPNDEEPKVCPLLTEVPIIEADVDFGNYEEMLAHMPCSEVVVDTPTRESLTIVAEKLAAADLSGPKIIVLATDGLPDSCDCPNYAESNPPAACLDVARGEDPEANWVERGDPPVLMPPSAAEQYDLVQEAKRIYEELGIVVHVVDVSTPNDPTLRAHLTDVATAAHGEIYDGTRPSGLIDAFQTIIDGARSCVIDLQGEIMEGKEDEGTVTLDGEVLTFLPDGMGDGWKLNSSSQLELVGEPCDLIKSGKHDIDIDFPCDVFIPEPIVK